ncbi:MAG TPA: hypothetical protein VFP68_18400 [Burkholderiaceae bacterium]|nr:hypothetical protein [Burkholderiaceae bacterium]
MIRKRRRVVLPDDNSEQSAQPEVRAARVHTLARVALSEQATPLHDAHVLARQELLMQQPRRKSLAHDRRPSAVQIVRPPLPEVETQAAASDEPFLDALGLSSFTVAAREWKEMNECFVAVQRILDEIRAAHSFRLP